MDPSLAFAAGTDSGRAGAGRKRVATDADRRRQAMDAAELIDIDYETLPSVSHSEDAIAAGAPLLWDECPNNIAFVFLAGDQAASLIKLLDALDDDDDVQTVFSNEDISDAELAQLNG